MRQKTKFKQTEIGTIPEDWEVKHLNEVCVKITDGSHNSPPTANEGKLIATVKDMGDFGFIYDICRTISYEDYEELVKNDCRPIKNDVLIAKDGSFLKQVFVSKKVEDIVILSSIAIIRPDINKINPYFLKYTFSNPSTIQRVSANYVSGAVIQRIILKDFKKILLTVPSLSEQKAIAKILSDIDDKIELNQQMNKTLEKIGQALFKHWFIDFEFPDEDGKPYKSSGGEMVDSELGRIPKRWKIGVITDITEILSGFAFKSSDFIEHGKYRLVTIKNVQDGYFRENTKDGLEKIPEKMPEYCKLKMGDVLLSLTGNVGRVCHVFGKNYLLNQRVAKLQPLKNQDYVFVYLLFRQKSILNLLENISSGTAQQNLSPIQTGNIKIFIPDREILNNFGDRVNPSFNKILENSAQIQCLMKIRDFLLPRLMSGRIRIEVAE